MPIAVPQGVDVKISAEAVTVKGGNGTLNLPSAAWSPSLKTALS